MRAIRVVAKREYLVRIRSKGFWISTIAMPVLMAAWTILPGLVMLTTKANQQLAVVDRTGQVAEALTTRLDKLSGELAEQVSFDLEHVDDEAYASDEALRDELDRRVLEDGLAAWIWIGEDALETSAIEYHAESVSNFLTQETLSRTLSAAVREVRLQQAGYDSETIAELSRSVRLDTVRVSEAGSRAEGGIGGFALALGLFMILYITTLIYGQQVMNGVLEEKTSRVIEVVLSAIRPVDLMAGKLIGICVVGLTQLGIWIATAAALTAPGVVAMMSWLPDDVTIPTLSPTIIMHFLLLFLLGYFCYATFYAMIGSAFNNVQEAQQMAGVAVIFVVAPWLFFMPILNDPDSTVAVVTSLIPLFTPFLMMLRIAIKMPPLWQLLLGYALTFGMCVGMTWLCARVYRVGILMYGKKPRLREIWRWIRYA